MSFNTQIEDWFKRKINLIAIAYCAVAYIFWMIIVTKIYYLVPWETWDIAALVQTLWSITHGSLFNSIFGANIFVEHCSFLCFLLAPFYWINPDPLMLQYFKLAAFFSGSYIFFLILKKRLHPVIALLGMVAYTVAPANVGMLQFSFNYEPFAIPLIFLIFKAFDEKKYVLYMVSLFLLAMVKEQMPLVVVSFGVFAFIFRKEDRFKWAVIPLMMGLVIFIVEVFFFIPYFRKDLPVQQVYYWARYAQFGSNPQEILIYLLTHPLKVFEQFIHPTNLQWYNDLFGIWGGIALFSPHLMLPAAPLFLKTIFSNTAIERMVGLYYYASIFTPFLFLAAWNTLHHIHNKWRIHLHSVALVAMFFHALVFLPSWLGALQLGPMGGMANKLAAQRMINQIPPGASVLAGDSLLAPLANRKGIYTFSAYLLDYYEVSGLPFVLPKDVEYLLLNYADEYILLEEKNRHLLPKITKLNFDNHWRLKESIEDIALYVTNKEQTSSFRLIEKNTKPFLAENTKAPIFDNTISLLQLEFPKLFPKNNRIFPMTFYWKSLKKTDAFFGIFVKISNQNKVFYERIRLIGSTIYPTYCWQEGEFIKEKYFSLLAPLDPGTYTIEIKIYNFKTQQWLGTINGLKEEKFIFNVLDERFQDKL